MSLGRQEYRGWRINVFRQSLISPYHPYTAYCEKEDRPGHLIGFNVDAPTPEQALQEARQIIDKKEP